MANKFAEDIRRIARGTRFRGPLGEYSPRDPIGEKQIALITDPMALGGGFGDGGLNNETPTSEAPNSETQQNENEGEQNPALDPNNPNSFYKGGAGTGADSAASEGSFDAADIIDGAAGPQTTNGTSGGVNEITGFTDCESGTPFNLQLDGNFPVPDGWEDAETPPDEVPPESFVPGRQWQIVGGDNAFFATSYQAALNEVSATASIESLISGPRIDENNGLHYYLMAYVDPFPDAEISALSQSCVQSESDPTCPIEKPVISPESWPEDGTFDLANKDGNLVTSDFDADKPAPYSSSAKDFCFGENRTGKILVTSDGGTMIYETNAEGAPTGTVRVYGRDGTAQAFGDATDAFISQYLPK